MTRRSAIRSGTVTTMAVCCLLASVSLCQAVQPASPRTASAAQQHDTSPAAPPGWEFGFDLFETLLESQDLRSRNHAFSTIRQEHWDRVFSEPSRSVMIFTGTIHPDIDWQTFHRFLQRGGAVLIATNEPYSMHGFFEIEYGPATTVDPRNGWMELSDCLPVTSINPSEAVMRNVSTIVTNRTGWIPQLRPLLDYKWIPLARLPGGLQPRRSSQKTLVAIAESQIHPAGRMIVMADDSPLSNGMLWHGDNLTLLINIVQELTRDNRTQYAFLHNGRPVDNRVTELLVEEALSQPQELPHIPPEALADLPAETLLQIGNEVAASIEDSDVLNELVSDRPRSLSPRVYRRSILLALCVAAILILLLRSWLTAQATLPWLRRRRPPEVPESPASLTALGYDQACQALSRDTCRLLTGSTEPEVWKSSLSPNGDIWKRLYARSQSPQSTAGTLAEVLEWSTQADRIRLSRRQFERFGAAIHDLKQLHVPEESSESRLAWT